jgi:hypothetical protein
LIQHSRHISPAHAKVGGNIHALIGIVRRDGTPIF